MFGYVVPTWYGYAGWGCLDYFLEQPGRYTFSEAFFANQYALVHRLLHVAESERDKRGLTFDRDAVAFYGDSAWEARMAPGPLAFKQTLTHNGRRYAFEVEPKRGKASFDPIDKNGSRRGGRPFVQLLDHRIGHVTIIEGEDLQPVSKDDFILVPRPENCNPAQTYRVVFTADQLR